MSQECFFIVQYKLILYSDKLTALKAIRYRMRNLNNMT